MGGVRGGVGLVGWGWGGAGVGCGVGCGVGGGGGGMGWAGLGWAGVGWGGVWGGVGVGVRVGWGGEGQLRNSCGKDSRCSSLRDLLHHCTASDSAAPSSHDSHQLSDYGICA